MVAGDTHGSLNHLTDLCRWAKRYDCSSIVQVGDWGFVFSDTKRSYQDTMVQIDECLAAADLTMMWLDGNHENFEALEEFYGADPERTEAVVMSDRVTYLPRGYRFELDGIRCMSFGGAVSIDKAHRVPYLSWWPQELITDDQVSRVSDEPVDVLFSHDCPEGGPRLQMFLLQGDWGIPYKMDELSKASRTRLREVLNKVTPKMVIHGHYHYRYDDWIHAIHVVGLGCNGMGRDSYTVLDTEAWKEHFHAD